QANADYWPQASALSQMLLGPVAAELGRKRLLIVATGALEYLPFAVLPSPGAGGKTTRPSIPNPSPLIVEHEIVHLPSASVLAALRREVAGRQAALKAIAVVADPVFSPDDTRVKLHSQNAPQHQAAPSELERALRDVRGGLRRLLMTRDEADAILSATPGGAKLEALDFQANRATAASEELGQYRIVHLATHGLLDSQHPELSGLVFSLVDERGNPQDGFLRL